jgi:predicted NBD/HSP70 family sugar kinase
VRDIGASQSPSVVAALCDLTGTVRARIESRVDFLHADPKATLVDVVARLRDEAGVPADKVHHVQLGVAGSYDSRAETIRHVDVHGFSRPGLVPEIAEALGTHIGVDNDVNLAAVAELAAGVARGVEDFVLLWADEGLGAAIVIDGRLRGGATGGAGEVGFLPLPGTPLVRDVRRGNAGAFQELAGGPQVLALARSYGLRAATPPAAVTAALTTPGAGDELLTELAHRFALGLSAMVAVVDPALVILSGGVLIAGGPRLRDLVGEELGSLAAARPRLELASIHDRPVLAGALHTALTSARDEIFDTVRQPITEPGPARAVTRRSR